LTSRTFVINPALSCVDATFRLLGTGFTRPTLFSVADNGFFGPSFAFAQQDVIPEPATLVLVGSGLAVTAWRLRRRRA
jgi:hypothetical protein